MSRTKKNTYKEQLKCNENDWNFIKYFIDPRHFFFFESRHFFLFLSTPKLFQPTPPTPRSDLGHPRYSADSKLPIMKSDYSNIGYFLQYSRNLEIYYLKNISGRLLLQFFWESWLGHRKR